MSPPRRPRRGFTLIEVTIALVVGGMAISAAAALLTGLGERADEIRAAGARVDRDANAERLLRTLWGNLRFSGDSATPTVSGDSSAVVFYAWCETVEGWLRPCRAQLAIEQTGAAFQYRLELTTGETAPRTMTLWHGDHGPAGIRYLRYVENAGTWVTAWSDIVPPSAVEAIAGADTLMIPTW